LTTPPIERGSGCAVFPKTIEHATTKFFPNNSANDSLNEVYRQVGTDSFYFDVEEIRSNGSLATTGKTFLLLTVSTDRTIKESCVKLLVLSIIKTMYTFCCLSSEGLLQDFRIF